MVIRKWEGLFDKVILQRGLDYYEEDRVSIDEMDEDHIQADVEGSELYSVEIELDDGRVVDMYCDCPYAGDGNRCKHMAAVLYAATEAEGGTGKPDGGKVSLKQAIDALPLEKLRDFLLDAAREDRALRNRIEMSGKKAVNPSDRKRWASDLAAITRGAKDRGGFIDYERAYDYTSDLCEYMDGAIEPLLENHMTMDAFELVGLVFTEAVGQDMDDSDGGLTMLAERCESYWTELFGAPGADRRKMLDWFRSAMKDSILEGKLLAIVLENFRDDAMLPEVLKIVDERIADTTGEYSLARLVQDRINTMKRMGKTAEEIEAYRKTLWAHPFIRAQELDQMEEEGRWAEALALLAECEERDKGNDMLLRGYSERRIRILSRSGQRAAYAEALKKHVFTFRQWNMEYVDQLKAVTPEGEWPPILERLFTDRNTRRLRQSLQLSEGMQEQLLQELEAIPEPYEILRLEADLRDLYPERVRDLMLKCADADMRRASTRKGYENVVGFLKRINRFPEGKEKASALAKAWRLRYPRRKAMMEELDKAKL